MEMLGAMSAQVREVGSWIENTYVPRAIGRAWLTRR